MPLSCGLGVERVTRIELALSAWEADVLPLNYTRARPASGQPPIYLGLEARPASTCYRMVQAAGTGSGPHPDRRRIRPDAPPTDPDSGHYQR